MSSRRIEDYISVLLKEKLEKKVKAEAFTELKTPVGFRKPDILCSNGGKYVIEAKFHEGDLWKAVAKIQNDYLKYHQYLGIKGGFAVLYPEELSKYLSRDVVLDLAEKLTFKVVMLYLPEDTRRNFHVVEGNISEISEILIEQIIAPPEVVEPSVEYIIDTLRDIANSITIGLKHLSGSQLEDLFGGKEVFDNILLYDEGKYPEEDLRLASSYILVNQLLFYHVLNKKLTGKLDEINPDEITRPSDLNDFF
jgi:hypothetical protein